VKFKLDENFGTRTQQLFLAAGHDVSTVGSEGLCGCPDRRLFEICGRESRCLVTMDVDFGDVTRFPRTAVPALSSCACREIRLFRFWNRWLAPFCERSATDRSPGASGWSNPAASAFTRRKPSLTCGNSPQPQHTFRKP